MTPMRRALPLLGWFAGLGVIIVVLQRTGGGAVAAPDLLRPGSWAGWAAERTPPEAAMAIVRLVGLGTAWYLLAATALGVAAHLAGGARAVRLADLVALPLVRSVVQVGLGIGLVGAVTAAAGARGPAPAPRPAAVGVSVAAEEPLEPKTSTTTTVRPTTTTTLAMLPAAPAAETPTPEVRTWTIGPGDHLWAIAEHVVATELGRWPTDAEVEPYWQALVEKNRERLPRPQDPDLVHAGLIIELPEPLPSRG